MADWLLLRPECVIKENKMELMSVLMIPVIALAIGWAYGRNTAPPLVEPELYVFKDVEDR